MNAWSGSFFIDTDVGYKHLAKETELTNLRVFYRDDTILHPKSTHYAIGYLTSGDVCRN